MARAGGPDLTQEATLGSLEFEHKRRKTGRERVLERIDSLVPWAALEDRIAPARPKLGRRPRPCPLVLMLSIHRAQRR